MGKNFDKNALNQPRMGLEKDIDWHNQKLWKRKKHRQQVKKNEFKKTFREYKKLRAETEEAEIDPKRQEFYENLFKP